MSKQQTIILSTLKSKTVKIPIFAGGQFLYSKGQTKSLSCKKVGFEIFLHTYQTDLYSDGHKDTYLINSKKIKTVLTHTENKKKV
jgi:hypothetical protein